MKKTLLLSLFLCTSLCLTACNQFKHEEANDIEKEAIENETPVSETPDVSEDESNESDTTFASDERIFSHKDKYTTDLYNLLASLPEEKPESSLKQSDVECDTLQWFNATYAMFTYDSDGDYHLVGGYSDESGYVDSYVTNGLEQSWGITDRVSAISSLAWLAIEGHASGYVEMIQTMEQLELLDYSESDLRTQTAALAQLAELSEEESTQLVEYYVLLKNVYDTCGENGIDAWDYCRIMQISGSCYYAGYITLEECLTIQLATATAIQDEFDSWEAMNASYLEGYGFWYPSAAIYRAWAYQKLQDEEDCPFETLDFNMKLEKFW